MDGKTDQDIFGKTENMRIQTGGRPKVNREKAKRLIDAGIYTTKQIAKALGCGAKTVRRIKAELKEAGELREDDMKGRQIGAAVEADFTEEIQRATGLDFQNWLYTKFKDKSKARTVFNFARKSWEDNECWDKPSLVRARDRNDQLGDQMCAAWLKIFGGDLNRLRDRKKSIRFFFRFIGRRDLCDRHLTMKASKDKVNVKRVPEISFVDFPIAFQRCIDEMEKVNPRWATFIKSKLVFMARTGEGSDSRGMCGLRKDGGGQSWLSISPHETGLQLLGEIVDKGTIRWPINYFPTGMKKEFYERAYKTTESNAFFFKESEVKGEIMKTWKAITKKHVGRPFSLHDLRKVSATWYFALKVPLDLLSDINVGWRDLNTLKVHYNQMRGMIEKSLRVQYRANIPDWFKEDIHLYLDEDD